MTRKRALAELIAKVEAGAWQHTDWPTVEKGFWGNWNEAALHFQSAYSGSLDAAKALHIATLPGWGWRIGSCHLSDDASVFPDFNCPTHGERLRATVPELINGQEWADYTDIDLRPAGNVARALLLSDLRALHAMEAAE